MAGITTVVDILDSESTKLTVNPGSNNITLTANEISSILLSGGGNSSPLSYGILCWGNPSSGINPPTNINITNNNIYIIALICFLIIKAIDFKSYLYQQSFYEILNNTQNIELISIDYFKQDCRKKCLHFFNDNSLGE